MVDPGAAQAIVKQLNRWYRKQAKPRGTIDHFHRGTRMSYTAAYRGVVSVVCGLFLCVAAAFYFVPGITTGESPLVVLLLKLGCGGMVAFAIFMLLRAFRECTVITDDGLIKCNLFGRETLVSWKDIVRVQIKPDDNKVIFRTNTKAKLTMSLSCDGWLDFTDMAAKHLNPAVFGQFRYALASIDPKPRFLHANP